MPHEVDELDLPTDPILRELQLSLTKLAGKWRSSKSNNVEAQGIVEEYQYVVDRLYSLGWDGYIDFEAQLPKRLMPQEYLRRHPEL
jgi:hypothetical protein